MALRGLKKLVGATCITLLAIGPSLGQGLHDHSRFHTTSQSVNVGVGGDGDIRAQLSWQNQSDLDLHMTQPDHGVHVYYNNRTVTFNNGGATAQLDHDNLGGRIDVGPDKRVENIVVTGENIPHGQYNFYVNNFRGGHSPYEIVIKGNNDGRIIVNNGVVNYSGENSPYYTINFDGTTVSQEIPNIPVDSIGSGSQIHNQNSDLHVYERQDNSPTYQNQGSGQNVSWNSGITTQPGQLYRDGNKYSFEPFIRQLVNTYDQFDQGNYNLGEIAGNISNLMKWDDIKFIGWDGLGDREYIIQHKDSRSPSGVVNYHMNVSLNRGGESLNSYRTSMGANVEGIGLPPINPQENIVVAANNVLPKIPNSPLAPEKPINVNTPISIITGLPANIVDSKSYESLNQNYNSVVYDYSNQNDLSDYDMLSNYLVDAVANCSGGWECFKAKAEVAKFSVYSSPRWAGNLILGVVASSPADTALLIASPYGVIGIIGDLTGIDYLSGFTEKGVSLYESGLEVRDNWYGAAEDFTSGYLDRDTLAAQIGEFLGMPEPGSRIAKGSAAALYVTDKVSGKIFSIIKKGDNLAEIREYSGLIKGVPSNWRNNIGNYIPDGFSLVKDTSGNLIYTSPAGLIYRNGSAEGHRLTHVLDHTTINLSKNLHTVFNARGDDALKLIDEAWRKKDGYELTNDLGTYLIPMGKKVGVNGETYIRISTFPGTNNIRTAYPVHVT